MKSFKAIARPVALCLAVVMFLICAPVHGVLAALIPTDAVGAGGSGRAARDAIEAMLDREDVRHALVLQGLDPGEARSRVAALSDAEAVQLAEMLDELPAGGGIIGFLVAVILVVFLVLLVTDLTGMTDVFPWVK